MASIQPGQMQPRTGLCIDYETVNASLTNYTFASDTNYYISSGVSLRGTNNIIQGGTVIKFTNSTSAKLNFLDAGLVCKTGPYKMAILTSKDDNSVGETISGSTGSPTNSNGATYLYSNISGYPAYTNSYRHLRFAYAGTALSLGDNSLNDVWHCQFVRCGAAIDWCDYCFGAF